MLEDNLQNMSVEELINLLNVYRRDSLTGLLMRRDFELQFQDVVSKKEKFHLMIIDVNNLKDINDTFGYLAGDELIRKVSNFVSLTIPCEIFRIGGDEFATIIKDISKVDLEKLKDNSNFSFGLSYNDGSLNAREIFLLANECLKMNKVDKKI